MNIMLVGMPEVDLGVNDMTRMGLEVVGRHDILPVPTEQWIRYEDIEFHNVVNQKETNINITKTFQYPLTACFIIHCCYYALCKLKKRSGIMKQVVF